MISQLIIEYTNQRFEAERFRDRGYEPIECAFGDGSVLGDLAMDHHGPESWREGVALRACRDHYGARRDDPRFVVTGTADADAVVAIIALAGLVREDQLPIPFYDLVNRRDLDPIGIELLDEEFGTELLVFQQVEKMRRDSPSFYRAVNAMCDILENGLDPTQRDKARRREARRVELAERCYIKRIHENIVLIKGNVWGFDRWYRQAPVVISYSQKHQSITIGCVNMEAAQTHFGPEGLLNVFPKLGKGWGGRETIGGSPRGKIFTFEESIEFAHLLPDMLVSSTDAKDADLPEAGEG